MNKNIYYIAYQDFPAITANSSQTISTCKYFKRNGYNTTLFFPLRSNHSDDNPERIKSYYEIDGEMFDVQGINHTFKFQKYNFFKKIHYILGHIRWSYQAIKFVYTNYEPPKLFFTRSDWVFYFLSNKKVDVIYECHQVTKLRKKLINISLKNENSKVIFLNKQIYDEANVKKQFINQTYIINNGYDSDFFFHKNINQKNSVIFSGNLIRLGKTRNIEFILESFQDPRLSEFKLKIIGGDKEISDIYKNKYSNINNVEFIKHQPKKILSKYLNEADIALMVNSSNKHSLLFTDPLKFYEYLACKLKVVAVDFPSHRALEKYKNIYFFENDNKNEFIEQLLKVSNLNFIENSDVPPMSIDSRIKKIITELI